MRTLLATAAFLAAVPGGAAQAHAFLRTSSPAVGATLKSAPAEVVINFTEGVEPAFSTIAVTDGAGQRVDSGPPHLQGGDTHLAVALHPLPPGTYRVTWHATATDTHKTQGSFTFTVQ